MSNYDTSGSYYNMLTKSEQVKSQENGRLETRSTRRKEFHLAIQGVEEPGHRVLEAPVQELLRAQVSGCAGLTCNIISNFLLNKKYFNI